MINGSKTYLRCAQNLDLPLRIQNIARSVGISGEDKVPLARATLRAYTYTKSSDDSGNFSTAGLV